MTADYIISAINNIACGIAGGGMKKLRKTGDV